MSLRANMLDDKIYLDEETRNVFEAYRKLGYLYKLIMEVFSNVQGVPKKWD